jgi:hypothetical protein
MASRSPPGGVTRGTSIRSSTSSWFRCGMRYDGGMTFAQNVLASYSAAGSVESGRAAGVTLLLISIVLCVVGALLVFDLFGFASNFGSEPSSRSLDFREKWGLPEPRKLIGWGFLFPGVALLVISVIAELILLFR